jgi:uncharacterized membrane protein YadS
MQEKTEVVVDNATSSWSDLWKKEDYWAIWLGFLILIVGSFIYFNHEPEGMHEKFARANAVMETEAAKAPFKTVAWYEAQTDKERIKAKNGSIGKTIAGLLAKPAKWTTNPLDSLILSQEKADALNAKAMPAYEAATAAAAKAKTVALAAQAAAGQAGYKDAALNAKASAEIEQWLKLRTKASAAKKKTSVKPYNLIPGLLLLFVGFGAVFGIGMQFIDGSGMKFLKGFGFVFAISVIAYLLAGQKTMAHYGIGYAAWAIAIGIPGIFVAWVVTPVVLITTFIFGQKVLKMESKTLNMVISADMSVCGTSAAIAAAAACKAKKEELTLAIGLSLVFTAIMMVVMPAVIKATGMPYILGGAWMGGTIDATGAVAAAGAFLSEKALYVAATIKMIQNVLIGVTAFGIAIYWCTKVECVEGQRVGAMEIWHRFPKFVLGFLTASVVFSIVYTFLGTDAGFTMVDQGVLRGFSRLFRGWFFCLSFAAIGLATNFRELRPHFKGGKPLILYACGQSLNLCLTLVMAYIMFYLVFPDITASI